MLAKERKKKPNTYRGYWGEGKELQCIVSVYHIFLNVSQHNLEQKHHSAGAGAATALRCSTQQQHSQSQSQRRAGLLSSSSVGIPPWRAAFMSSLRIKMNTRIGWQFFPTSKPNIPDSPILQGAIPVTLLIPDSQQEGSTAPKEGEAFWTPSVCGFLLNKQA